VTSALEKFGDYHIIWQEDRDESLEKFMKDQPKLSEFESKIKYYEEMEVDINNEPVYYDVGPIALFTGTEEDFLFTRSLIELQLSQTFWIFQT